MYNRIIVRKRRAQTRNDTNLSVTGKIRIYANRCVPTRLSITNTIMTRITLPVYRYCNTPSSGL